MLHSRSWQSLQAVLLVFGLLSCSQSTSGNSHPNSGGEKGGAGGSAGGGGSAVTTQGSGGTAGASASGGVSAGTSSSGPAGGAGAAGSVASGGTSSTRTTSVGGTTDATSPVSSAGNSGTAGSAGGGGARGGATSTAGTRATGGAGSGGVSARDAGPDGAGGTAGAKSDAAAGDTGGSEPTTCPAGASKPSDGQRKVTVGTASRSYTLHVPAKYDGTKPVPLVVDYHGLGGSGSSEAGSNPYKAVIDPEGVISAYPDGMNGTNGTGWNIGPCCNSYDDVAFAKALVQDVAKVACIDLKHVYAVGFSLGGGMVHVLGCNAADVFAAISPAAADLVKETVDSCKPARPLTVISFRGSADTSVPYAGGTIVSFTGLGAQATFKKWAELDSCTGSPSAEDSNGCSTYSSCAAGVQVTLCTKKNGGHEPGNASVSWPILKKYALP